MTSTETKRAADSELDDVFAPIFARIADGAVARETDRTLTHAEVDALRAARFGALRVPVEHGGYGASVRQLFRLLIDLAAAESNLPQALRVHFSFVEDQLLAAPGAARDGWLRAIGEGTLVGNAITEPGVGAVDRYRTRLTRDGDHWRLDGTKYYSTGSLYADHILVAADRDGERVGVLVGARADGVRQHDDWDGFGQRLTASGTTEFTAVRVTDDQILGPGYGVPGPTYATAYLQLVQLAVLAGIAQRAESDVREWVSRRTRGYTHSAADLPRHDPLVQQVIGKLSAAAFAARATVLAVAELLDAVLDAGASDEDALTAVELAAAQAQLAVIDIVLPATSLLFEVGGASIVSEGLRLDRHWRNARTISVHNPAIQKARVVGDHLLNGTDLPFGWSAGERVPAAGEA
ncbi:acyl-CoA dehydrogenase family protein [Nocardia asteroides]|uniref:Oxidoreductase n=1 Tax=Nocardia asteroides NBRC 15531 TaxID=1110697 RepID=U5E3A5_NOCAS|nr:acyl-CoA dehydrogenase family protein [Nocardia asteroides]TLF66760.1 acyl-CoA dehydrogenase [Nocardia asteroides NBRC 15531]UGT46125.1 acyl-CoA dehydrogenase family protein [Nocardia asteroides]SFN00265.1 Acyl-CoA dehydrogenase [Nocardia asteroides]VEG35082.1 Acyl-CoA dehydrogenase fadE12 [Nocardia asteroides]GAD82192.1 putative oxidoreductase [Nocardia asteroides NBRC 15531]